MYKITKQICGNTNYKVNPPPAMDTNGRLLTNKKKNEDGQNTSLKCRPEPQHTADVQPAETDLEIETFPQEKAEIRAAIATQGNDKAPETDSL